MKLNGATIKSFFLYHGEKLAFAVVAAVLAAGGYALVTHESYQKDPDSLVKASNGAREYVRGVTWDAAREQVVVVDPNVAIDGGRAPIPPAIVKLPHSFTSGGGNTGRARGLPELLAPIELEVSYGFGPIALSPKEKKGTRPGGGGAGMVRPGGGAQPGGGAGKKGAAGVDVPANSEIGGYHFVCLRAVVPAKEQSDLFAKAFLGARFTDPKTDQLKYDDFVVERSKVNPNDPTKFDWQPIKTVEVNKVERWPKVAREVVPLEALDAKLTSPLPPLLTRDWGFEVAHSRWPIMLEDMQLNPLDQPEEDTEEGEEAEGIEEEAAMEDEETDADEPAAPQRPRGGGGLAGGAAAAGGPGLAGAAAGMRNSGAPHATGHAPNEDFLFRFFDFTVKPKEHYVYRIALKVANPNYGLHQRHLESADLAKDRSLIGPTSAPSREIEIPGELYYRVGEAKAARGTIEPSIRAMVVVLDNSLGIQVSHKQEKVLRGQVLDFPNELKSVENPKTGEWEEKEYDFTAGAILLDLRGGPLLPIPGKGRSKVTEPGEALFLDKNGQLVSHRELLEAPEFEEFGEELPADAPGTPGIPGLPGGAEMPGAPTGAPGNPFDEVNPKAPKKGNR